MKKMFKRILSAAISVSMILTAFTAVQAASTSVRTNTGVVPGWETWCIISGSWQTADTAAPYVFSGISGDDEYVGLLGRVNNVPGEAYLAQNIEEFEAGKKYRLALTTDVKPSEGTHNYVYAFLGAHTNKTALASWFDVSNTGYHTQTVNYDFTFSGNDKYFGVCVQNWKYAYVRNISLKEITSQAEDGTVTLGEELFDNPDLNQGWEPPAREGDVRTDIGAVPYWESWAVVNGNWQYDDTGYATVKAATSETNGDGVTLISRQSGVSGTAIVAQKVDEFEAGKKYRLTFDATKTGENYLYVICGTDRNKISAQGTFGTTEEDPTVETKTFDFTFNYGEKFIGFLQENWKNTTIYNASLKEIKAVNADGTVRLGRELLDNPDFAQSWTAPEREGSIRTDLEAVPFWETWAIVDGKWQYDDTGYATVKAISSETDGEGVNLIARSSSVSGEAYLAQNVEEFTDGKKYRLTMTAYVKPGENTNYLDVFMGDYTNRTSITGLFDTTNTDYHMQTINYDFTFNGTNKYFGIRKHYWYSLGIYNMSLKEIKAENEDGTVTLGEELFDNPDLNQTWVRPITNPVDQNLVPHWNTYVLDNGAWINESNSNAAVAAGVDADGKYYVRLTSAVSGAEAWLAQNVNGIENGKKYRLQANAGATVAVGDRANIVGATESVDGAYIADFEWNSDEDSIWVGNISGENNVDIYSLSLKEITEDGENVTLGDELLVNGGFDKDRVVVETSFHAALPATETEPAEAITEIEDLSSYFTSYPFGAVMINSTIKNQGSAVDRALTAIAVVYKDGKVDKIQQVEQTYENVKTNADSTPVSVVVDMSSYAQTDKVEIKFMVWGSALSAPTAGGYAGLIPVAEVSTIK